jgi:SNF family Na+-dependent transporter
MRSSTPSAPRDRQVARASGPPPRHAGDSLQPSRPTTTGPAREQWSSRIGVIFAVAGSAVGLGNFLRFPGRAALYGGGAFMIPYFVSLLILGIPICWIEWTLGRHGGRHGFNSAPGIFAVVWQHSLARLFGALAVFIPIVIYMYYVFIESWCFGYAWQYLTGAISPPSAPAGYPEYFASHFNDYIGVQRDGALLADGSPALLFLGLCFALNFLVVYRGLAKGIEALCKWAMPALIVAALVILARVLTLGTPDPGLPERSVLNGLGFMWNPKPTGAAGGTFSALFDPQVWLEAAGQIFFTLSVGFGVIMTYASYLGPDDDVTLAGLTAAAANEFCEVCLGGLITIPAAFLFLGAVPLSHVIGSSIGMGFHAVPVSFEYFPFGHLFGFLWFGLLALAALTSSVSMLQPALAFLREGFALGHARAVALLALLVAPGTALIAYCTENTAALDVMDFWVGSTCLVVLALFEVLLFGWIFGAERGIAEANRGSDLRIPAFFSIVIRFVAPLFLCAILGAFAWQSFAKQARAVLGNPVALTTAIFLVGLFGLLVALTNTAARRWRERLDDSGGYGR